MPCNEFLLHGYKIEEPDRFMSKRKNVGLKDCIFLHCHCLELSRKLLAHYITCAHYCWMSSMIGKIGLAGARGGKHIPWEIPLFSGLLSMFDTSIAKLGRRRCSRWLFDTKLDILPLFPLFLYFLSLFLSVVQ